jgi:hypothetical protein
MSKICFVIQPFDEENNKRYQNVIEPAIQDAELEPYRVDMDKSVQVPIKSIEEKIKESEICFADISDDNPNVWYEVGFAVACEKKLVLACSDKREKYPFDIQHKNIVNYKARTGHKKLKKEITARLKALLNPENVLNAENTGNAKKSLTNKEKNSRFPSKQDLQNTNWWKYFEPFSKEMNLKINPIHTCVGVPYGTSKNKGTHSEYGNTLYRIRTTKDYYSDIKDKNKNLPTDLEIELWRGVYDKVSEKIDNWLKENNLQNCLSKGKHLDSSKKTEVKIIKIDRVLSDNSIKNFNEIIKEGFNP